MLKLFFILFFIFLLVVFLLPMAMDYFIQNRLEEKLTASSDDNIELEKAQDQPMTEEEVAEGYLS